MRAILISIMVAAAALGGWFIGRQGGSSSTTSQVTGERKISFYQSPMHPWIKSDKPGNCTICGMKLAPVYEGDQPMEASGGSVVQLSPSAVSVVNVQTADVRVTPLQRTIRVAGTIENDETQYRRLSAYVGGRIEELGVRYVGAEVQKGELLAKLYSPALIAARDEYLLIYRQPTSPQRDRLLKATGDKLVRMGVSREQLEDLPSRKELPDALEILAPMSGTVVARNVYEGQYVKEGDLLFEIGDFSRMWFVFEVYERDLAWVAPGQEVQITSVANPGRSYMGTIDFIDPNLNPATRSAKARVVLENPLTGESGAERRELLNRTYADGEIKVETAPVLAVPRSAVLSPGGEALAYVAHGPGAYEPRKLKLGKAGTDLWEVIDGLKEGEKVVTNGNLLIDAQAQLDHGHTPFEHAPAAPASTAASALVLHKPLTEEQKSAAKELFAIAGELSEALAADDLERFNKRVAQVHPAAAAVAKAYGEAADWVTATAQLEETDELPEARKDYYPFSKALAEFAHAVRQHDPGFAEVRIFECPMVKDAVPNAPERKGRWVQLNPELRNPFFGAEMLECGVEVRP